MARPTLRHHRKFRALSRALRSPALAWGTLELLWHVGYDQGDAHLGTAQDVEEAICWRGKAGAGVAVLLACGWLDETTDGYSIHDLWDHCPDYVRKRRAREDERKGHVRPPSDRTHGGQVTGHTADTRRTEPRTNGSTPSPSPSPAPAPTPCGGAPLVSRGSHKTHALCGQVCLPGFLADEFCRLVGGDEATARAAVDAWWLALDTELARGHPPIGESLAFLRDRWAAAHPTPRVSASAAQFARVVAMGPPA